MNEKGTRKYPEGSFKISLWLVPGTDEFRAYNQIVNDYIDELSKRRETATADTTCPNSWGKSDIARGAILALADVPPKKLPNYIQAAWKHKGRKALNPDTDGDEAHSDTDLEERPTLLH